VVVLDDKPVRLGFGLGTAAAVAMVVSLLPPAPPARAEQDYVATERSLLEVIQSGRAKQREQEAQTPQEGQAPKEGQATEEEHKETEPKPQGEATPVPTDQSSKGNWAILPQVGLSPEKGANGGIKLTDRDFTRLHLTFDLGASAAVKGQMHVDSILISPSLGTDWLMGLAEGEYYNDPTKEFFGLGNNDVGPDHLSTNRYERWYGTLALGVRASRRVTLVLGGAYNDVVISHGHLEKQHNETVPSTGTLFPNMSGINGGTTNPLTFAVLFNDRQDLARPTRGWSIIAKATWVPEALGNDFHYTRYNLDMSYLYPLLTRRQVIGLNAGGQYLDTGQRHVPFYELAAEGGSRDLRGYFQDRFLGDSNVVANAEYRLKLFDFDWGWHIQIDGVAFGDAGRVFMGDDDVAAELGQTDQPTPSTHDTFRFSYGGGTRIALGEALVARIDVGFSDEETGLVYLVFGHTF
jgi:surface antigen Omp85-like protein